jgi:four helix bundle protein
MNIQSFEDIIAWQKARIFTNSIYRIFKDQKDFSFKNQIERASVSIMNNIAEGFERQSDKELRQFLYIAKGSCAEVRSMLYLAYDLKYISGQDFKNLSESTLEISRILHGFIKKL